MIEGKTILCFASGYDAPPTSKHHVMHLLAERNTVLWVNYHASRTPTASSSDLAYMAGKLRQVCGGLRKVRRNLYVLTPLVLPLPGRAWARRANRLLLIAQVRSALARVRRGPVQAWSFAPDISYLLGEFGEEKVVYYCVDDFASFSGYDRDQVLRDEADLCRRADLVVTTSAALQEAKSPLNPNTILVTHGVDYEHFSRAMREDLPVPEDMKGIPHPILGFFGLIRDWVDLDLLAQVCRRRTDWHVVLIGDSAVDLAPYRNLPNMHFLGHRSYADLPAYCKGFDIGLVPFKVNELTRAVNPIKLREYLAAGLPVISTPLPEVRSHGGAAVVCDGVAAFLEAAGRLLGQGAGAGDAGAAAEARRARSAPMASETWAGKLRVITESLLSGRPRPAGNTRRRRMRVVVGVGGGGFIPQSAALLEKCPPEVEVVLAVPRHMHESFQEKYRAPQFRTPLFPESPRQLRSHGPIHSLLSVFPGVFHALRLLWRERPAAAIMVGQRAAVPLFIAAKLLGVRTVFVETFDRVKRPSTTGRVVSWLSLADRIYVQWPGAVRLYRGAVYAGRIV
jgi:glycosyltransferase involved in cell wall biosynthesis